MLPPSLSLLLLLGVRFGGVLRNLLLVAQLVRARDFLVQLVRRLDALLALDGGERAARVGVRPANLRVVLDLVVGDLPRAEKAAEHDTSADHQGHDGGGLEPEAATSRHNDQHMSRFVFPSKRVSG